ncbi:hypothetical protein IDM40_06000 [Nocardiopsis sp. HNM0947]|uniref:Uncharacterized protein n=1 Tax=Nocardiopsis coralli TaxID=2772213 RepID=A0ABR9P367_9ACTN|nr:hypothetical protein [Nocardiopsis coralli]MBE2998258.1 hypothetical protein [Nocardiopsis coralli]
MADSAEPTTGYDPTDPENAPLTLEEQMALEEQDRKFAELRREREATGIRPHL